jgi:streptogramin lyase
MIVRARSVLVGSLAVLMPLLMVACNAETLPPGTGIELQLESSMALPAFVSFQVTLKPVGTFGELPPEGQSMLFPYDGQGFPVLLDAYLPDKINGRFDVRVVAQNAAGAGVASGNGTAQVHPGQFTRVVIDLTTGAQDGGPDADVADMQHADRMVHPDQPIQPDRPDQVDRAEMDTGVDGHVADTGADHADAHAPDAQGDLPPDACVPTTSCEAAGRFCGMLNDGCQMLDCGTCNGGTCDTTSGQCQCAGAFQACGRDCADLRSDSSHCGACGHDCFGGACQASTCQAVLLDNGQDEATTVAVDAQNVYWIGYNGGNQDMVYVKQKPLAGGPVLTLAGPFSYGGPLGIAVDPTSVYFAEYVPSAGFSGVASVPIGGGPVGEVSVPTGGNVFWFALDGGDLYWTDNAHGTVLKVTATGNFTTLATGQTAAYQIAVDATHLYWVDATANNGTVMTSAKNGTQLTPLATGQTQPLALAIDSTHVYWVGGSYDTSLDGYVRAVPKAGGPIIELSSGEYSPRSVAVDDTHVYWVTPGDLRSIPKVGGSPRVLAPSGGGYVALDQTSAYWSAGPDIYRVAKPLPCADGLTECGSDCVDLTSDETNCGGCGNACSTYGSGLLCQASACQCQTANCQLEFDVQAPANTLQRIVAGSDGRLWFSHEDRIRRITPSGIQSEVSVPGQYGSASGIINRGPDGNVWFVEGPAPTKALGKITSDGTVTELAVPAGRGFTYDITAGADGNLWYSDNGVYDGMPKIGRVTPAGVFTLFDSPDAQNAAGGMIAGPDGNVWFGRTDLTAISRITPSGTVSSFTVPNGGGVLTLVAGPDGNVWYFNDSNGRLGRVTPAGAITESAPLGFGANRIILGPDGNFWAADGGHSQIVRMTPSLTPTLTAFDTPTPSSTPSDLAVGPDGNIWYIERASGKIGYIRP